MPPIEPIVRIRICAAPGCPMEFETPHGGDWPAKFCSRECHRDTKRSEAPAPRRTAALVTKPSKKPKRPISIASKAQAVKRNTGASIVSGETRGLQMAHICPRALGGCDDPDCVVALTEAEHRAFDTKDPRTGKSFDLLPYLVAHGCHAELAHALWHYRLDVVALLERVTGERWMPADADQEQGCS